MTDAAIAQERFDLGRVISRTFGVLGRNFGAFIGLSVLLAGVPAAVMGLIGYAVGLGSLETGAVRPDQAIAAGLIGLVTVLVLIVSTFVLQGALVHNAVSDLSGRKTSLGASLGVGLRYFLPLLAVGLMSGIAIALGLILLIVPGAILATMWAVLAPAVVVDRSGVTGAFERSAQLTKGSRWNIFGLMLIYVVFAFAIALVFEVPGQLLMLTSEAGGLIYLALLSPLESAVTAMIAAAGVAALYVELRQIKEGVGADTLAAVFD